MKFGITSTFLKTVIKIGKPPVLSRDSKGLTFKEV
jgi:hypothetical protein